MSISVTLQAENWAGIMEQVHDIIRLEEAERPEAPATKKKKTAPATKKTAATKAPPEEVEEVEEVEELQDESPDPKEDMKEALDLLIAHYSAGGDKREKVKALLKEYSVAKFSEIPAEKGTELLKKAQDIK